MNLWSSNLVYLLVVMVLMMSVMVVVAVLMLCCFHKEHGEAGDPCLGLLDELFGGEHLLQ